MFGRFFSALRLLTANAETLAASFAEANQRFRETLALDETAEPPAALSGPVADEDPDAGTRRTGRGRGKASV
jgi:hypothetical protein